MLTKWLESLPERTREIIAIAGETVEKFDGNVKMMETLATLSFMRATESLSGTTEDSTRDQVELVKVAGALQKHAADLKRARLEIMDQFEGINDTPKPANIGYIVIETGIPEQIRRFLVMGMLPEAQMLCQQNDLDIQTFLDELALTQEGEVTVRG